MLFMHVTDAYAREAQQQLITVSIELVSSLNVHFAASSSRGRVYGWNVGVLSELRARHQIRPTSIRNRPLYLS
jgi:hypothetical protein